MDIEIPPSLHWVSYLAGDEWPTGSETAMALVDEHYQAASRALDALIPELDRVRAQTTEVLVGQSGAAAHEQFSLLFDGEHAVAGLADAVAALGDSAGWLAIEIEYIKLSIVFGLASAAVEISWALANSGWTAGGSLSRIPITEAVSRACIRQVVAAGLRRIASAIREVAARTMVKRLTHEGAQGALEELGFAGIEEGAKYTALGHESYTQVVDAERLRLTAISSAAGGAAGEASAVPTAHVLGTGRMAGTATMLASGTVGNITGAAAVGQTVDVFSAGFLAATATSGVSGLGGDAGMAGGHDAIARTRAEQFSLPTPPTHGAPRMPVTAHTGAPVPVSDPSMTPAAPTATGTAGAASTAGPHGGDTPGARSASVADGAPEYHPGANEVNVTDSTAASPPHGSPQPAAAHASFPTTPTGTASSTPATSPAPAGATHSPTAAPSPAATPPQQITTPSHNPTADVSMRLGETSARTSHTVGQESILMATRIGRGDVGPGSGPESHRAGGRGTDPDRADPREQMSMVRLPGQPDNDFLWESANYEFEGALDDAARSAVEAVVGRALNSRAGLVGGEQPRVVIVDWEGSDHDARLTAALDEFTELAVALTERGARIQYLSGRVDPHGDVQLSDIESPDVRSATGESGWWRGTELMYWQDGDGYWRPVPRDVGLDRIPPARTGVQLDASYPLREEYRGEDDPSLSPFVRVHYLSAAELEATRVFAGPDGRLYRAADGTPFHSPDWAMFVMDRGGNLYATSSKTSGRLHHSSFLAGAPVAAAGQMKVAFGRLLAVHDQNGHHRATANANDQGLQLLRKGGLVLGDGFLLYDHHTAARESTLAESVRTADVVSEPSIVEHVQGTSVRPPRQRILVFCDRWGRNSGMETLNMALCRGLARAGHEVYVRVRREAEGEVPPDVTVIAPRHGQPAISRHRDSIAFLADLPESVDMVIGHGYDGGMSAVHAAEHRYPDAKCIHLLHLLPMTQHALKNEARHGRARLAADVYMARRSHLVAGVGPVLAAESLVSSSMAGRASVHELRPMLTMSEQPPLPSPDEPERVLLFGRTDDPLKGVGQAARMVRGRRSRGHDTRLVTLGGDLQMLRHARHNLAALVGEPDAVEVLPRTSDPDELQAIIRSATVVVMPSRVESFGLVAAEAIEQGVPVMMPSSSGAGRFLASLADYREAAQRFNLVEQHFGAPPSVDAWTDRLDVVLNDLPAAWANARQLQERLAPFTPERSADHLVDAALNAEPGTRVQSPPGRAKVRVVGWGVVVYPYGDEISDHDLILAVADAMETDPEVRAAIAANAPVNFGPAQHA
ncbi:WXG100-like domain-containing protein [Mycolicibacterium arenosum]|uniref:Glycosyltransferase n=1 Tax=Mycolicibacterium arenosum TaxID=2952157 RepID=A0ABT1M140_9MYCO|nr:glycosyltransferase [Mycolicibacterium sp. CAU 1645]MCP9271557.1 glycosyltransferase [Mycolicibacterium sp. CAU 1645]